MTHHYVEDRGLIRTARSALTNAADRDAVATAILRWLRRQPTAPRLVSPTRAAEILGVKLPHLVRLKEQGRMPDPIPIAGSRDAYLLEEVEALGRELAEERAQRAERTAQKEAAA
jgi:predicted DNA-binding transcriptional regulator AlpA